jgi:cytochrome o ubiquinol oxidase operon protein cyoD
MDHHSASQPDYGTGQKKLGMYMMGFIGCSILTLISFWAVMSEKFSKPSVLAIIYVAACVQFLVQLICFLRLNTQTDQGRMNVMGLWFTGVILVSIIGGSLWIMWNLAYYMDH